MNLTELLQKRKKPTERECKIIIDNMTISGIAKEFTVKSKLEDVIIRSNDGGLRGMYRKYTHPQTLSLSVEIENITYPGEADNEKTKDS